MVMKLVDMMGKRLVMMMVKTKVLRSAQMRAACYEVVTVTKRDYLMDSTKVLLLV